MSTAHAKFENTITPCWFFDVNKIKDNYDNYKKYFEYATIAYALKSNPHSELAKQLIKQQASFCVVSTNHIKKLLKLGADPKKIHYSHVIKTSESIRFALDAGVEYFCYDSYGEIDRISQFSKPVKVYIRLNVPDTDALIDLNGKFGASIGEAVELIQYAAQQGLQPIGVTFNIGSQCTNIESWIKALKICKEFWDKVSDYYDLTYINMGGGFPAYYNNVEAFNLETFSRKIKQTLFSYFPNVRHVILEPGRGISASTGSLLTSVIGTAKRSDGNIWVYLDAGIFNGLFEALDGIKYPVDIIPQPGISSSKNLKCHFPQTEKSLTYMLAGPTCDSLDKLYILDTNRSIEVGDKIIFRNTGSYGYSLESNFNGFDIPAVKIIGRDPGACPGMKVVVKENHLEEEFSLI